MKFSIIIPTYNSNETIKKCIDSILSQTYTHFEVWVIDGISTDGTLETVNRFSDHRIHLYSGKDSGVYDAMNKGIDKAAGEWLYFLGSDDYFYDNQVLENIASFITKNNYDIVYGNAYFIGRKYFHDGEFTRLKLSAELNICHQAIFYKKSVFSRLGYYNLEFPINADWDFNMRCFATPDLNIRYIDLPIVNYNDITGLSDSGIKDTNFHEISAAKLNLKIKEQAAQINNLNNEIVNIRKSVTYKIGRAFTAPFRWIRILTKK